MSVKLIDNEAFYGFRVRRTVNGKLYQEYFSLKKSGNRLGLRQTSAIRKMAEVRDVELRTEQEKSKQRRKAELCFHDDGSVKGISYLIKTEKSGTHTPIFQIGIASELDRKIICTSFSINAHGAENAWTRAVDTYARHKLISHNAKLYKKLLAAMPRVTEEKARRAASGKAAGKRKSTTRPTAAKKTVKKVTTRQKKATVTAANRKRTAASHTSAKAVRKQVPARRKVSAASKSKQTTATKKPAATNKRGATDKRPVRKKKS